MVPQNIVGKFSAIKEYVIYVKCDRVAHNGNTIVGE